MTQKKLFMVDDDVTNLTVGKNALIGKYHVVTIPSGGKLLKILERATPDMILLDVEMPEMNGYEVIKLLKNDEKTAHIPVIFLTGNTDTESEYEGLSLGAIDYITKPFSPQLLLKRVEVHMLVEQQKTELKNYNENLMEMVKEKTRTVVTLQNAILKTVAGLVEFRDDITGSHIERTQQYLKVLADALIERKLYSEEVLEWDMNVFLLSAQLHDVGKIAIKDYILCKPGRLTTDEYEAMKEHTVFGEKMIEQITASAQEDVFLQHAKIFAVSHHERWDGNGYPGGLAGADIPLQGRLMAIADVYDALISERPYKEAFTHAEALEIMKVERGKQFDPYLLDVFFDVEEKFRLISEGAGHKTA